MHQTLDGKLGTLTDSSRSPIAQSTLETERLLLRRFAHSDAAALHGCTIEAHWQRCGFGDFTVLEREPDALVGFAGLHRIAGMAEVNVGRALVPVCWERGLGTELCHPLLAHGFTDLGLPEIVAVIDPRNTASVAPANRCGLTFRRDLTWQGQARVLHAMMRAEFEAGP